MLNVNQKNIVCLKSNVSHLAVIKEDIFQYILFKAKCIIPWASSFHLLYINILTKRNMQTTVFIHAVILTLHICTFTCTYTHTYMHVCMLIYVYLLLYSWTWDFKLIKTVHNIFLLTCQWSISHALTHAQTLLHIKINIEYRQ